MVNAAEARYGRMKFPKYTYKEYPKMLYFEDGTRQTVQDRAEELKVSTTKQLKSAPPDPRDQQYMKVLQGMRDEQQELAKGLNSKDREIEELRAKLAALQGTKAPTLPPSIEEKGETGTTKGNPSATVPEKDVNKIISGEVDPTDKADAKGNLKQASPTSGTTKEAFPKSGNTLA